MNTYAQIFVPLYLLDAQKLFHNESLLNRWKDSWCCRESPRSLAFIRRQSVTAVFDRWVGLWALSWLTDTKFHWQPELNDLLNEQRRRKCWQADHGAAERRKRQGKTEGKQRGRVIEGDWHASTMSLLLTCFWSCCCSTDDETLSQVKPDLPSPVQQGYICSPWGNPSSPSHWYRASPRQPLIRLSWSEKCWSLMRGES